MKAVILISHGSRLEETKHEVCLLVEKLKHAFKIVYIECAFLEIETPSIPDAIAACVDKGIGEIIILLNFLNAGRHVNSDIPRIIDEARLKFPQVKFFLTKPVGQHEGMLAVFSQILAAHLDSLDETST